MITLQRMVSGCKSSELFDPGKSADSRSPMSPPPVHLDAPFGKHRAGRPAKAATEEHALARRSIAKTIPAKGRRIGDNFWGTAMLFQPKWTPRLFNTWLLGCELSHRPIYAFSVVRSKYPADVNVSADVQWSRGRWRRIIVVCFPGACPPFPLQPAPWNYPNIRRRHILTTRRRRPRRCS
jgi:hypothetical protein